MKKTLLMILVAVVVITSVIGVTTAVSIKNVSKKPASNDTDIKTVSSEDYEVIEFIPPEKTVYSLSEVYTVDISTNEYEKNFVQQIDFDGTGMSMTIKHKKTGETQKYDYSCEFFNLEGEIVKCENYLTFNFNPEINTVLAEGEHTVSVVLRLGEGETIVHDMSFTLVDDTTEKSNTPSQTENKAETNTQSKNPVSKPSENTNDNQENHVDKLVVPQLRTIWYHTNNPNGCTIEIENQNGNTLDLVICSSNENATKIATAKVSVTLDDVYFDGAIVRGNGAFEYTDSFGNSGTGTLNVSENVIILVINEEYNAGRGFGISYNTGKYL